MRQRSLAFRTRGGKRKGAGRPRADGRVGKGIPHLPRPVLASRFPVHCTWRMAGGVWNLRSQRCFTRREHFRLVHFAVMGNHLHVLVEASDREGLTRGMQGLGIRIARALNHLMQRRGRVVDDRYHAHILRTPTEVRHARRYLLNNAARHYGSVGTDAFASQRPLVPPRTWLLRQTC
jgi:REP element-mobilizing transposase RayT